MGAAHAGDDPSDVLARAPLIERVRSHRYATLLALLLVLVAVQSFDRAPGSGFALWDLARTLLGIAILLVAFERRGERRVAAVVLAAIVALSWARHVSAVAEDYGWTLVLHALMSIFLSGAVYVLLRDLFARPPAGVENVLGAICGYLIAGIAWADINAFAYVLAPSSYAVSPGVTALVDHLQGRVALFSYYGFAQMLTIGYADVTPVRAPATTLSLFGALFGLFYTAVVVSQFLALAQRPGRGP
jgi:voltage-gated potassium channel